MAYTGYTEQSYGPRDALTTLYSPGNTAGLSNPLQRQMQTLNTADALNQRNIFNQLLGSGNYALNQYGRIPDWELALQAKEDMGTPLADLVKGGMLLANGQVNPAFAASWGGLGTSSVGAGFGAYNPVGATGIPAANQTGGPVYSGYQGGTTPIPPKPPITPIAPPPPPPPVGGRGGNNNNVNLGNGIGTSPTVNFGNQFGSGSGTGTTPTQTVNFGSQNGIQPPAPSIQLPNPNPTQPTDYSQVFKNTGYDGSTIGYAGTQLPLPSTMPIPSSQQQALTAAYPPPPGNMDMNPQILGGATSPNMMFGLNPAAGSGTPGAPSTSPFPTGAQTMGQATYPWLAPYAGNFTAPMTSYENQGLSGISSFVGGGQNLGGAQNYVNGLLSGQYLSPSTNPALQQYIDSLTGVHNYQDDLERQRIGSSMAAGGNALSGARSMAEEEYQNESNNQFQNQIASMLNANYQMERGLQQAGVPLQMGLSGQQLSGMGTLMNAGGLPRNLQQQEYNSEYQDWLRQISGMQQAYNQPEQQMLQLLSQGGYKGAYSPQYGQSDATSLAALLAALGGGSALSGLLGGGTSGGGGGGLLGSLANALFGGGSTNPNQPSGGSLTDPNNPFGFSSGGNDLASLMAMYGDQTYDPSNPFGFSSNGSDLSSLMGSVPQEDWTALDSWLASQQGGGNG